MRRVRGLLRLSGRVFATLRVGIPPRTAEERRRAGCACRFGAYHQPFRQSWLHVSLQANPSYVDMIDQTTTGHRWLLQTFNVTPKVTWQIDPFGHSSFQVRVLR